MTRVEAYHILGDLWYEVTSKEAEAITIAQEAVQFVDLMPKDMVAVVRCKDCKFFKYGDYCTEDKMEHSHARENDFCSYGERKDGDADG